MDESNKNIFWTVKSEKSKIFKKLQNVKLSIVVCCSFFFSFQILSERVSFNEIQDRRSLNLQQWKSLVDYFNENAHIELLTDLIDYDGDDSPNLGLLNIVESPIGSSCKDSQFSWKDFEPEELDYEKFLVTETAHRSPAS